MFVRPSSSERRRGTILAESAVTFSIVVLLSLGTISVGLGVVQYQELNWLAQESARWAAVHGPTYQSEQTGAAPSSQSIITNVITPKAGLLSPGNVNCSLTMTNGTASVTLTYVWTPPVYLSPITLRSSSSVPVTY